MPEVYVLNPTENIRTNHDNLPTRNSMNKHSYTPELNENPRGRKPEVYFIGTQNDNTKKNTSRADHYDGSDTRPGNDNQSYKSTGPLINNSRPLNSNGPEFFHITNDTKENNPEIHQPLSNRNIDTHHKKPITNQPLLNNNTINPYEKQPIDEQDDVYNHPRISNDHPDLHRRKVVPMQTHQPLSDGSIEMYHLSTDPKENNTQHRPPLATTTKNNRISPIPLQNSPGDGPEMYHLSTNNENPRENFNANNVPRKNNDFKPNFANNNSMPEHNDPNQPKPTMYTLTTKPNGEVENFPQARFLQRTPSPVIGPTRKPQKQQLQPKQRQEPDSYDSVNDTNQHAAPPAKRPFPTTLRSIPSPVQYIPMSHSRASKSIERSMNKYRFLSN